MENKLLFTRHLGVIKLFLDKELYVCVLVELLVLVERAEPRLKKANLKCIIMAEIRTKYGQNQSSGKKNEKEVIDSKNLMMVNTIIFRME